MRGLAEELTPCRWSRIKVTLEGLEYRLEELRVLEEAIEGFPSGRMLARDLADQVPQPVVFGGHVLALFLCEFRGPPRWAASALKIAADGLAECLQFIPGLGPLAPWQCNVVHPQQPLANAILEFVLKQSEIDVSPLPCPAGRVEEVRFHHGMRPSASFVGSREGIAVVEVMISADRHDEPPSSLKVAALEIL